MKFSKIIQYIEEGKVPSNIGFCIEGQLFNEHMILFNGVTLVDLCDKPIQLDSWMFNADWNYFSYEKQNGPREVFRKKEDVEVKNYICEFTEEYMNDVYIILPSGAIFKGIVIEGKIGIPNLCTGKVDIVYTEETDCDSIIIKACEEFCL